MVSYGVYCTYLLFQYVYRFRNFGKIANYIVIDNIKICRKYFLFRLRYFYFKVLKKDVSWLTSIILHTYKDLEYIKLFLFLLFFCNVIAFCIIYFWASLCMMTSESDKWVTNNINYASHISFLVEADALLSKVRFYNYDERRGWLGIQPVKSQYSSIV